VGSLYVAQADHNHDPPASASQELGLQLCSPMPTLACSFQSYSSLALQAFLGFPGLDEIHLLQEVSVTPLGYLILLYRSSICPLSV
jgi:hypothetical protein